ncbi:helix-turn-helix domain-containing protein [Streptomyces caatingaensis]|uniref:nSTAND1 domain-containing NTPase n=1 Tax=Streptomyces caatingaensis TaxID=1678637 RepID=UPI0006727902|nr:helix-turn-helix domain-containing protein [Streptomyces caatingaensis]
MRDQPASGGGGGPAAEPRDAAAELRRLRRERGMSLAALARAAFYSKGHLSKVENGDKPLTPALARACDRALGTGGLLERALAASARPDAPPEGPCPYRGLAAYGPDDARWFFGRARATAALVGRVAENRGSGLLLVVGPSGAGKSSLLGAGLLAALTHEAPPGEGTGPVVLLTPGEAPVAHLLTRIAAATTVRRDVLAETLGRPACGAPAGSADPPGPDGLDGFADTVCRPARPVLVVDQFEETFTLCPDPRERRTFVRALHALATRGAPVVLGVRADFYDRCLAHPELVAALRDGHLPLGPMNLAQVREAITGPAREAGLAVEPGLVEILLRDAAMTTDTTGDLTTPLRPGVLPLLSHALLATWQHRENGTLTVAGYQRTGGISGAVAATAERAYTGLSPLRRSAARQLLLHLVHVDETGETGRRMERPKLLERTGDPDTAGAVLDAFADARLLTLDAGHVELAHEALLRAWPRLRAWIAEDRAGLRTRQALLEDAEAWAREDRDPGLLYRGTRLAVAREWAADPVRRSGLGPLAGEFLDGAVAQEAAERRRERRRTRRLRGLVAGLVVLLVLSVVTGGLAVRQNRASQKQQRLVTSREFALQAEAVLDRDPERAVAQAVQAYRAYPTGRARSVLVTADGEMRSRVRGALAFETWQFGHGSRLPAVLAADEDLRARFQEDGAVSGDGRTVAVRRIATVEVRDAVTRRLLASLPRVASVGPMALSPDGRTLVTVDGLAAHVRDVRSGRETAVLHGPHGSHAALFSPDGRTLAVAGLGHGVALWDLARRRRAGVLAGGAHSSWAAMAFSPDGRALAISDFVTPSVRVWDTVADRVTDLSPGDSPRGFTRLAFSADGARLAAARADGVVELWDVPGRRRLLTLAGGPARRRSPPRVQGLGFTRDGGLAAVYASGERRLWELDAGAVAAGYCAPVVRLQSGLHCG